MADKKKVEYAPVAPGTKPTADDVLIDGTAVRDLPKEHWDETLEGGKFIVGGVLVNARGREINADGSLKNPNAQATETEELEETVPEA